MKKEKQNLNIYLLRHGEKLNNEDGPLTKIGRSQAKLLAKRLKKLNINKIYSSNLKRCKETAEIISKQLKLPIEYNKALREVPSIVKEQPEKNLKEINVIKKFWEKVKKQNKTILLISSGIVNRIIISFALNIESPKANFMQYPTGLTKMEKVNDKRFRIWYINDTSHLPDKLKIRQQHKNDRRTKKNN